MPQLHSFPHTKGHESVIKLKEHDSPLYPQYASLYPPWIRTSAAASASQSRGLVGVRPLLSDSGEFVGLRPFLSESDKFVGLRRICRSPTKFVGLFTQWIQLTLLVKSELPTDPISGEMNPQEPSAHRLVKSISLLPPRERGNVSSRAQSPTTIPIRYIATVYKTVHARVTLSSMC